MKTIEHRLGSVTVTLVLNALTTAIGRNGLQTEVDVNSVLLQVMKKCSMSVLQFI